jgi:hypothetical protein
MDTSIVGTVNDAAVTPIAPPPVAEEPREGESPAESVPPATAEDSGKTLDLYV